jgi:hypothetical protein
LAASENVAEPKANFARTTAGYQLSTGPSWASAAAWTADPRLHTPQRSAANSSTEVVSGVPVREGDVQRLAA